MSQHVTFLLLGLANGAVFAVLGLALTVTYRSSGVMNFATSSMALFTAYIYAGLRRGELVLLVPGLPESIDIGAPLQLAPSVLISLGASAALGLVLYLAVFRPLRAASATAKAVASARRDGRHDRCHGHATGHDAPAGAAHLPRRPVRARRRHRRQGPRLVRCVGRRRRGRGLGADPLHPVRAGHPGGVGERAGCADQRPDHPTGSQPPTGCSAPSCAASPAS